MRTHFFRKKNIYSAHEVLQMKVLWEREGMYQRFLEVNDWVHGFLPNWIGYASAEKSRLLKKNPRVIKENIFLDWMERIIGFLQRRYMGRPSGQEKVTNGALFFHPYDVGPDTLAKFEKKVKLLSVKREA